MDDHSDTSVESFELSLPPDGNKSLSVSSGSASEELDTGFMQELEKEHHQQARHRMCMETIYITTALVVFLVLISTSGVIAVRNANLAARIIFAVCCVFVILGSVLLARRCYRRGFYTTVRSRWQSLKYLCCGGGAAEAALPAYF